MPLNPLIVTMSLICAVGIFCLSLVLLYESEECRERIYSLFGKHTVLPRSKDLAQVFGLNLETCTLEEFMARYQALVLEVEGSAVPVIDCTRLGRAFLDASGQLQARFARQAS